MADTMYQQKIKISKLIIKNILITNYKLALSALMFEAWEISGKLSKNVRLVHLDIIKFPK